MQKGEMSLKKAKLLEKKFRIKKLMHFKPEFHKNQLSKLFYIQNRSTKVSNFISVSKMATLVLSTTPSYVIVFWNVL